MQNEFGKAKTSAKLVMTKSPALTNLVQSTMADIAAAVGVTLGPGGLSVIIERNEAGLPNILTKDGVTVFKALGYSNSIKHCIMETAREGAIRTASEAGDGTTTATILSEAIVRKTREYCTKYPKVSPQKVVRTLEKTFNSMIEPELMKLSRKADFSTNEGKKLLHSVATISANGDTDLADAVIKCFELVGDEGNVTITEQSGPSHYEVERIKGFSIGTGYEESCTKYFQLFINDANQQRIYLEKPIFVVYHGVVNDMQTILTLMNKIANSWQQNNTAHNVVLVATGFSDNVLGNLALNFVSPDTINVVPLLAPKSPMQTGQLDFLEDLAAVAGTYVFNPMTRPLDTAEVDDLGSGVEYFEASRFKSNVVGHANEDRLMERVEVLQSLIGHEESILEKTILQERLGKLTGGIAKLKVVGSSNGELREKKDRADDAVCAVRGAIKKGCLPGGGWSLLYLASKLINQSEIVKEVMVPALYQPINVLLNNAGLNREEADYVIERIEHGIIQDKVLTYDVLAMEHVDAFKAGILDSTPAVVEALRNSISIAGNLGTLGAAIAFPRDHELEHREFKRIANLEESLAEAERMEKEL